MLLKMLHFKTSYSLKKDYVVSCNCKNKNIMLFLAAVSEREFPVSMRNIEISSESDMFLILQSEDSEI